MVAGNRMMSLQAFIDTRGLKRSKQRDLIAEIFFASEGHISIDELWAAVRKQAPRVSQATVYRTMKLLVEAELAHSRQFQDGFMRYEPSDQDSHHDHIICTSCGKIVEFLNADIERMQEEVAINHGFTLTDHKMELYGACRQCQIANR